jgi:hypothetical protein
LTLWLNRGMGKNLLTITYPYFSLFRVGVLSTHTTNQISTAIIHDV